ncbi:MAG: hypothetical protein KJO21_01020 [Verrucomicrobiae bacterium]|nr:hypothetical protein [Verrucomicrobiae bacterium]NNJ42116.1 hypothetical protein [Akkermansiaceae bacterium]
MALHEPWSIKSRAHVCAVTETHFTDGESFYTALFPDPESSGYLRKDFSIEAWENRSEQDTPPFSHWQSIYRAPVKEEEVEITEESPEELLRRLIEEDQENTENARYILAIMLERKKLLVEADSQPVATGIIRIYEHRKSGDVFIVKDPNIPLSDVQKVQDEVTVLLENGGRQPDPEDTEPEDETSEDQESEDQASEEDQTPITEKTTEEITETDQSDEHRPEEPPQS